MYVSGPGTYSLDQTVKRQRHSRQWPENLVNIISHNPNKGNFMQFWSQMYLGSSMCWLAFSNNGQRSRSLQVIARKTGWIQYLCKYFHQNWVMYVPAHETYWLGQKVKGHSSRRHNRRWQPVEFHLHCVPKRWTTQLMVITLSKPNWFSKFFHHRKEE